MNVGAILGFVEAILGNVGAILALSWEDLGATWVHLRVCKANHEQNKHTLLKGVMEPQPTFAYKTNVCLIVLKCA